MFSRSLPVSIAVHLTGLLLLFIIPLAAEMVLPVPPSRLPPYVKAVAIPPPPAPPVPAATTAAPGSAPSSSAPIEAPPEIRPEVPPTVSPSAIGDAGGIPGAPVDTGAIGMPAGRIAVPVPPPPPRPAAPVRIAELLVPPRKIVDVRPTYPEIARGARVQGTVVLEAVLDRGGRVSQVRVVRSSPLLDQAALEAVRQWRYTPSVLHGQPVEVLMTVTITFTLQ